MGKGPGVEEDGNWTGGQKDGFRAKVKTQQPESPLPSKLARLSTIIQIALASRPSRQAKDAAIARSAYLLNDENGWQNSQRTGGAAVAIKKEITSSVQVAHGGLNEAESSLADIDWQFSGPILEINVSWDVARPAIYQDKMQGYVVGVKQEIAEINTVCHAGVSFAFARLALKVRRYKAQKHRLERTVEVLASQVSALEQAVASHTTLLQSMSTAFSRSDCHSAELHDSDDNTEAIQGFPGSDWTNDPQEQSQIPIPRSSKYARVESEEEESWEESPYVPLLDSQIEKAVLGGFENGMVPGKPPGVRREDWASI
ncbi:hypothetical protein C8J57DRAFT_1253662 [Mycena rebaudengoi]|nr:hypothetical protein C8J57DRAFT_1253662 [Mycena rebaudengoi]